MASDFKKQLKNFFLIYISLAVFLLALNFWLSYDISRHVAAVQNNKKEIFSYDRAKETLASLGSDFEEAKVARLFLESILPQSDKLFNFSKDVGVIAKQAGVESSFTFATEVKSTENTPGYINFSMNIKGNLNNWMRFLDVLRKSRYVVAFDVFNVSGNGTDYQLTINGKIFSQ